MTINLSTHQRFCFVEGGVIAEDKTITTSYEMSADTETGDAVITYNGAGPLCFKGHPEAVAAFAKAFREDDAGRVWHWYWALHCQEPAATVEERIADYLEFGTDPAPWFVALLRERHEAAAAAPATA